MRGSGQDRAHRAAGPGAGAANRSSRELRQSSRFAVLRGIYTLRTPTRQELVTLTGLSFATVSNIVNELLAVGMLAEASREDSNGGRPRARLTISRRRGILLGVDVAETYIHVDAFDTALNRLWRHEHQIRERSEPEYVVGEIADGMRAAIERHPGREILGAGVSMPGQVEHTAGVSVFAPNWAWHDVPVQDMLAETLPVPITLDNPLKAQTVAELWFGHGRSVTDMITVNLGTGVGAGIALNGRLIRGVTNNAGEWGHTTLVMDGRLCRCGRRGCVEAYIGVPGLMAWFREQYPGHRYLADDSQTSFMRGVRAGLEAGEPEAQALLDHLAHHLGAALANLVNLFNPELIVLASWTATELAPWLLEPTRTRVMEESLSRSAGALELVLTELGESPVVLGMATLALESFLENVGLPGRMLDSPPPTRRARRPAEPGARSASRP